MSPLLKYYGGKWKSAPWIIEHLPEHILYAEPFCGAASVLLRKPISKIEVINDMNERIVNMFRVLRHPEQSKKLMEQVALTPRAFAELKAANEISDDPVEDARRTIILGSFGFGGWKGRNDEGWERPTVTIVLVK